MIIVIENKTKQQWMQSCASMHNPATSMTVAAYPLQVELSKLKVEKSLVLNEVTGEEKCNGVTKTPSTHNTSSSHTTSRSPEGSLCMFGSHLAV